jgi:hypothetical protein
VIGAASTVISRSVQPASRTRPSACSRQARVCGSSLSKKYGRGTPKISAPPAGAISWMSRPFIAWNNRAASATDRASGPT